MELKGGGDKRVSCSDWEAWPLQDHQVSHHINAGTTRYRRATDLTLPFVTL
jgi:hypothetical protein